MDFDEFNRPKYLEEFIYRREPVLRGRAGSIIYIRNEIVGQDVGRIVSGIEAMIVLDL